MNENAQKYIKLFRQIKNACASTVDEKGNPQSRMIYIAKEDEKGMYIVTARGKAFYKQLVQTGKIALSAICNSGQALRFQGKVKRIEKEWVDKILEQSPELKKLYPGKSRYILEAFLIYEGEGEWMDLLSYPIRRQSFYYGNIKVKRNYYQVLDFCTSCGGCKIVCPQKCIIQGVPFQIQQNHCIRCGLCMEVCPLDAICWIDCALLEE